MTLLHAILLGLIQGVSEFLPVSSSGHLLVFHHIFGISSDDNMTFIIVLNMGSLMPLLWVFREDVIGLIKNPFQKLTGLLILSVLPIIIVTIFFQDFIESMFTLVTFLPIGFVITGGLLILSDRVKRNNREIKHLKVLDVVLVGLAQACAVFPGLSRSGSTITALLGRKLDRNSAAKFSFLMSIPTAFGAIILRIGHVVTGRVALDDLNFLNLGAGFLTAAITGYFAINAMLTIVKKGKLKYFAFYYVFALAIFVIVFLF